MTLDISALLPAGAMMRDLAAADTLELMERIGQVAETSILGNFEGQHDPNGVPWLPSFRVRTEGGKTLQDDGGLIDTVTYNATANMTEAGASKIYARIHNEGGVISGNPFLKFPLPGGGFATVASVTMPQRQFVGWGAEALEESQNQAEDWLAGLLPPGALS